MTRDVVTEGVAFGGEGRRGHGSVLVSIEGVGGMCESLQKTDGKG